MARKNDTPDPKNPFDALLNGPMKDSAQQIWLAGLGALAKAQQEGGRVFEALVKEGAAMQQQNPSATAATAAKFAEAADRMTGLAGEAAARAAQPWDRLETIFEERVAKALARMGIPTAAEVAELRERVDALTARLDAKPKPAAKRVAKKAPARKKL